MSIRLPALLPLALLVMLLLFWIMQWMIQPPRVTTVEQQELPGIEIVQVEEDPTDDPDESPQSQPPPPPPAPPALARPDLPTFAVPMPSAPAVGEISVPLSFAGGSTLSGSQFGGFSSGTGQGAGDGHGTGRGFSGRELIPLSTARPQMPEWACRQNIKGWVEVVFTVMPNGRVRDVKIVDAEPRGVYETAAIESVSNWIYESSPRAREVKQRVQMDPRDCDFNWQRRS
jgi:protein TonB